MEAGRRVIAQPGAEKRCDRAFRDEWPRDILVVQGADLFQRVRKGVVPDVVEQRGRANYRLLLLADRRSVFSFAKEGERASGEVVGAECVLKTRVCRAGIDQICPPELAHISQSLKDVRINELECEVIDPNVVPDRVAQDLEVHGPSL